MISIVVCSVYKEMFEALERNIGHTIGTEYELIRIDNGRNTYSLAQAYNKGAKEAKGDLLCFVHEDVKFHTQDWGKVVLMAFTEPSLGLLGIAGTYYYPLPPVGWFSLNENEISVILHLNRSGGEVRRLSLSKFPDRQLVEVAVIDGVFMVMPSALFPAVSFDEVLLHDFHGYDVDISLQAGLQYKVAVTKDILLEHFSEGEKGLQWHSAMEAIEKKWRQNLPRFTKAYSEKSAREPAIAALNIYYRNTIQSPRRFLQRFIRLFGYAVQRGMVWQAVKIILRSWFKRQRQW